MKNEDFQGYGVFMITESYGLHLWLHIMEMPEIKLS